MATRSYIGKVEDDGSVRYIYCHSDGYMSHNGVVLFFFYNTKEKLDALIAMGDVSSLGSEIGEKHDFNNYFNKPPSWSRFYNRDRGDDVTIHTAVDEEAYYRDSDNIPYLFKDGEWFCEDSWDWPHTPENTVRFSLKEHIGKDVVRCSYNGETIGIETLVAFTYESPDDYEEEGISNYEAGLRDRPTGSILMNDVFAFFDQEKVSPTYLGDQGDIRFTIPEHAMAKFVLLHC